MTHTPIMVMKAMPYTGYLVLRQIVIMSWQVREGVSLMGLGFPPQATVQQPADVADLWQLKLELLACRLFKQK